MAKAPATRKRKTTRKSSARAKGGMVPWYGAAALVVIGIVAYDNREELARYLPAKPAPAVSARREEQKPQPAPRPAASPAAAKSGTVAAVPVPPMSVPAGPVRSTAAAVPQPAAKPMLASLPPPVIPTGSAADGSTKMVGAGFKGRFYYCGRSGLNDCIAERGVFWHNKTAVRLADVEVPSAESAGCEAERQRGFRAKVRLRELLDAGPFDLVLSDNGDQEQSGAKLRVAMRGGVSLGDQLMREGLARPKGGRTGSWC